MSTTVNVRVDKSKLTQKLKEQSEANRFAYENGTSSELSADEKAAQEDAVAKAVAAAKKRSDNASYLKRDGLRDPIGRRGGSGVVLPDGTELLPDGQAPAEGTLVQLARVGIRWNANRTKVFVYPWGIEGAYGRRLSADYETAKNEASAVGVELSPSFPSWTASQSLILDVGNINPLLSVPGAEGRIYKTSGPTNTSSYSFRTYTNIEGKRSLLGIGTLPLDSETITISSGVGFTSVYTHYLGDTNPGSNSYTVDMYKDVVINNSESGFPLCSTTSFVLPAGGDRALFVLISRTISERRLLRHYYQYSGKETIVAEKGNGLATSLIYEGGHIRSESAEDAVALNEVKCVLLDGATATEVPATQALASYCDSLFSRLDVTAATGTLSVTVQRSLRYGYGNDLPPIPKTIVLPGFNDGYTEYRDPNVGYLFWPNVIEVPRYWPNPSYGNALDYGDIEVPIFELSNAPKQPYYDKSANEQALAKHLGLGYIETATHTGPFYTPAIFEWLKGTATFTTNYADVAPPLYTPADENNPFVGVYLSVTQYTPDSQTIRATTTRPLNVTTAHTANDWYTINTGSKWGDLLVWDWGNPEYCRQQLASLGMNV
jgi:hypothetical protein